MRCERWFYFKIKKKITIEIRFEQVFRTWRSLLPEIGGGQTYFLLRCVCFWLHWFQNCLVIGRCLWQSCLCKLWTGILLWRKNLHHYISHSSSTTYCLTLILNYNIKSFFFQKSSHPFKFVLQASFCRLQTGILLHQWTDLAPHLKIGQNRYM